MEISLLTKFSLAPAPILLKIAISSTNHCPSADLLSFACRVMLVPSNSILANGHESKGWTWLARLSENPLLCSIGSMNKWENFNKIISCGCSCSRPVSLQETWAKLVGSSFKMNFLQLDESTAHAFKKIKFLLPFNNGTRRYCRVLHVKS